MMGSLLPRDNIVELTSVGEKCLKDKHTFYSTAIMRLYNYYCRGRLISTRACTDMSRVCLRIFRNGNLAIRAQDKRDLVDLKSMPGAMCV